MPAPAEIRKLVERFEANLDAYRGGGYNETLLRHDFLDPFFRALGWDIDNSQDYAEAFREVIHEDAIKVGGSTKAPDYSFRIGGRRIFFLEAKKPAVFSKEAVLKGSFDRYARETRGKRGTATVDTEFLAQIEQWRDLLAKNLALRNPGIEVRELNFAVQATIDRIVFLRICEDRGIEPLNRLQGLTNGPAIYPRLAQVFREADDRYNSGLFHFKSERGRPGSPDAFTLGLKVDDKLLKDLLNGLYYPESPYEFSVLPADILGQVYERFLGSVIRLTAGGQAKVEEKPEVKKAGGVYYTPTYIVDYIVKQTVGRLLESQSPRDAAKLKILDPACGSGSFLIGPGFFDGRLDLDEDERRRINAFDWQAEFPAVFPPLKKGGQGGFQGGFDAVIGNPPYVRQESLGELKDCFQSHYEAYDGVADLYAYFMEKGVGLLRDGGLFSIIVSSSFLRASYGRALRETLKKHAAVLRLVDFGGLPVFANAKDKRSAELIKPLLGGEDIRRYLFRETGQWLIFARRGVDIARYPAIRDHLAQWKEELTPKKDKTARRGRKPGRNAWYEIQDDVAYFEVFDKPKAEAPPRSRRGENRPRQDPRRAPDRRHRPADRPAGL